MRAPILCLLLAACGGDGELTELEGVYAVESWTVNPTACDVPGADNAFGEDFLFVKNDNFLQDFVNVVPCGSLDSCLEDARDDETVHLGGFDFIEGSDAAGWTSTSVFAFGDGNGDCQATRRITTMVAAGDAGIEIERRSSHATYAQTGDECPDEEAEEQTLDLPCDELELIAATFAAAF
jgi:hypothetical protein